MLKGNAIEKMKHPAPGGMSCSNFVIKKRKRFICSLKSCDNLRENNILFGPCRVKMDMGQGQEAGGQNGRSKQGHV